jgi:hypothetical protein
MTKPHKIEVNTTKSGSLTHFDFFWTRNGQSRKIKYFLRVFLSEDSKNSIQYLTGLVCYMLGKDKVSINVWSK